MEDGQVVKVKIEEDGQSVPGTVIGLTEAGKWSIATFDDRVIDAFQDAIVLVNESDTDEMGFDAVFPATETSVETFCRKTLQVLQERNFCIVQMRTSAEARNAAAIAAQDLDSWSELPVEFQHDYLGRMAQEKSTWFQEAQGVASEFLFFENQMDELSYLLSMISMEMGFAPAPRSNTMVRVGLDSDDGNTVAEETSIVDASVVHQQLSFVDRRRLSIILPVRQGAAGAQEIELIDVTGTQPGGGIRKVIVHETQALVFRHDLYDYRRHADQGDVAMQCWILREQRPDEPSLEDRRTAETMQVPAGNAQLSDAPKYGSTGEKVEVTSCHTFYPARIMDPLAYWSALAMGTDGSVPPSLARWDHSLYWSPENDPIKFQGYSRHGGFTDTCDMAEFDADFFGMSPSVAAKMDPLGRKSLEVGYETLHRAGWKRSTLLGAKMTVAIGMMPFEVHRMAFNDGLPGTLIDKETGDLNGMHACSTRLSYMLGVIGPNYCIDTACSASLSAVSMVHASMRPEEPGRLRNSAGTDRAPAGLALGMNSSFSPTGMVMGSQAGMLSHQGRCFTFDQSADGYLKSEGLSGLHCKVVTNLQGDPLRLSMLCGTSANQDGKSASLTAPNGPSQQEAVRQSLSEAKIPSLNIQIQELHGTGTALGDPIEIGALRAVMMEDKVDGTWVVRKHPLVKTSGKSNIGHMELNAGLAGLIKCVVMSCYACAVPNVHLRELNSHIDREGYPVLFTSEVCDQGTPAGYFGVSSFGFSGCNARADIWGTALAGTLSDSTLPLDITAARCKHLHAEQARTLGRQEQWLDGGYLIGDPTQAIDGNLQISGSFNGRMSFEDMYAVPDLDDVDNQGVAAEKWSYLIRLGETRVEYFRLNTDLGEIFPRDADASMGSRVLGPGLPPRQCQWKIDARLDPTAAVGSYYKVLFWYDPALGVKRVTWELATPVEEQEAMDAGWEPPPLDKVAVYSIVGSFSTHQPIHMRAVADQPLDESNVAFEYTMRIGMSGMEDFQIWRQADSCQAIYPLDHAPQDGADVPVCGPDSQGEGKYWRIRGQTGERVQITIEVSDGSIRVSSASLDSGLTNRWTTKSVNAIQDSSVVSSK